MEDWAGVVGLARFTRLELSEMKNMSVTSFCKISFMDRSQSSLPPPSTKIAFLACQHYSQQPIFSCEEWFGPDLSGSDWGPFLATSNNEPFFLQYLRVKSITGKLLRCSIIFLPRSPVIGVSFKFKLSHHHHHVCYGWVHLFAIFYTLIIIDVEDVLDHQQTAII